MCLASSLGKGPSDYVDEASSRLERTAFGGDLRHAIGRKLSSKLNETNVQTLFDISDENLRTYNAICSMKREKLIQDWGLRSNLIAGIKARVETLGEYLNATSANRDWPNTALLAGSIHAELSQFQDRLNREFESIKHHQRLSQAMLEALSLKTWRDLYVAELDHYIAKVAFPALKQRERDLLLAGTMWAAHVFSKRERADEVVRATAMARSRANSRIKTLRNLGDAPVFRTTPKKPTPP